MTDDALTPAARAAAKKLASRLSRQPVTSIQRFMIRRLAPGKHARWVTGAAKRFLRSIQDAETLTDAQRRWLYGLARQYGHKFR